MDDGQAAAARSVRRVRRAASGALALAAVLVLGAGAASVLPPRLTGEPGPVAAPTGPGALPPTLYPAQVWTPSVVDRPISRAAYVVAMPLTDSPEQTMTVRSRVWVVGADDGALRRLPTASPYALDLSADGRYVAWVGDEVRDAVRPDDLDETGAPLVDLDSDEVAVLDVRTGTRRLVTVGAPRGHEFVVTELHLDATGSLLLVRGADKDEKARLTNVSAVVDVASGAVRPLCEPRSVTDQEALWRSPGVVAVADCRPLPPDVWLPVPEGDAARRLAAVTTVPLAAQPASRFATGTLLPGFSQLGTGVSASGTRWHVTPDRVGDPVDDVLGPGDDEPERQGWLVSSTGLRVDLGRLGGADPLASVGETAVLSTWTPAARNSLLGPSRVLGVDLRTGEVRTLSRSATGRERVGAVAVDVLAGGRSADVRPTPAYRDAWFWVRAVGQGRLRSVWAAAAVLGVIGAALLVGSRRRRVDVDL